MIPVDQDQFGKGNGNCWSACIASILERPLADFKFFHDLYLIYGRAVDAGEAVSVEMIDAHRLELERLTHHGIFRGGDEYRQMVPIGFSIASGMSPRNVIHSCVASYGTIVHDPHPDRLGLLDIRYYEVLVPIVIPTEGVKMSRKLGPYAPAKNEPHHHPLERTHPDDR